LHKTTFFWCVFAVSGDVGDPQVGVHAALRH
jgi:hypothetical protein